MTRFLRYVMVGALLAACASADSNEPAGKPAKELAAGGARLRGGGIRMDVQLGRGPVQRPGTTGPVRLTPNAVVTP